MSKITPEQLEEIRRRRDAWSWTISDVPFTALSVSTTQEFVSPREWAVMDRDLLLQHIEQLEREKAEAQKDAARWRELTAYREITFRDDRGLWVATWKRATGDMLGIVRAHLDAAIDATLSSQEQKEKPLAIDSVALFKQLFREGIENGSSLSSQEQKCETCGGSQLVLNTFSGEPFDCPECTKPPTCKTCWGARVIGNGGSMNYGEFVSQPCPDCSPSATEK